MLFENIKKHFVNRKQEQKENQEQAWYLIEYSEVKDKVKYIVDQKLLEVMLMEGCSHESFSSSGFANILGWHIGTDKKVYVRYKLNNIGMEYHERAEKALNQEGKQYVDALNSMNEGKEIKKSSNIQRGIRYTFYANYVDKITKYEGKELKQQPLTQNHKDGRTL